jgi:hypothetical protein
MQVPDPLIEAIEGAGAAPAYRGTAYVVFEDLPVDAFGARMPQLSFEVVRPARRNLQPRLEDVVNAVNLIPGAGEFALATDIVRRVIEPGVEAPENQHSSEARADLVVSLDQLEAELPNVRRVNLVIGWFGDDLRAGVCRVRPGVDAPAKETQPIEWMVAGRSRSAAHLVSRAGERANYGGTPADKAVRQAVGELKARGLHVTLYPFLFMDVPPGNGRPDPYGGTEQAAFPWRGRITAGSTTIASDVATFFAGADGYDAFILHYANLAAETGADGLLIGSELVGLTRQRTGETYPAVEALRALAQAARIAAGPLVEISYAADWTEYGANVEGGEVRFPLDALWADAAIDYVGVDWYPPMSDWRDGDAHADAALGGLHDPAYLSANIEGGEAYDWHYADPSARAVQQRSPITDGAYGEPWVFRQKDVRGWWSHAHHPRVAGVRAAAPTAWTPGMKPVRFVEVGVPGVDKGANQPNVFFDPKSSESALPHFSDGSRDDVGMRTALEAFHAHWAGDAMLGYDGIAVWAWDARPFPAFPLRDEVWGDGGNWRLGHWLNGRTGLAMLPDVVADVCRRAGLDADISALSGVVSGYRFDGPTSARRALDPLALAYGLDATERGEQLVFRMRGDGGVVELDPLEVIEAAPVTVELGGLEDEDVGVRLSFLDAEADHQPGLAASRTGEAMVAIEAPLAMDRDAARGLAGVLANEMTAARQRVGFALGAPALRLEPGDGVRVNGEAYRIVEVEHGAGVAVRAIRAGEARALQRVPASPSSETAAVFEPSADVVICEPPPLPGAERDARPLAFAFSKPWVGPVVVSAGPDVAALRPRGQVDQPCLIGRLLGSLSPHVSGRWQDAEVSVRLPAGALAWRSDADVLNGANAALVETPAGWELIQFVHAELTGSQTWRLARLLRGQQGSEHAMAPGAGPGARVLFLSGAERRLDVAEWEQGLELVWRAWRRSPAEPAASGALQTAGEVRRPWSPAHFRTTWEGADIRLAWLPRGPLGDGWDAEPELPSPELYEIAALSGGAELRRWRSSSRTTLYPAVWRSADRPDGGPIRFEVASLGAGDLAGRKAALELDLPAS